ncbi:MAG: NAD(P)H-binding protein [Reyranella sp.]|nr:NAD(P)H-binding protein [Reyranella sp.]
MFVIMGATGQVGSAVLQALKQRKAPVRAVARDPVRAGGLGVEVVRGEASDAASLAAAFKGAEAAFVMLVPPPQAADVLAESRAIAQAIAKAVRASGVPHLVALSSVGAQLASGNGIVQALHDFEAALAGAAPSMVFLRPGYFMENWAAVLPAAQDAGVLPSAQKPLDAKGEIVSARDVGRTAAELLLEPHQGTRIVNLAGPAQYSPVDAAAILSKLLGKEISAVPSSREETVAGLVAAGMGADYAAKLADLDDAANEGRMEFAAGSGEMQRGTVTLEEVLRRLIAAAPGPEARS